MSGFKRSVSKKAAQVPVSKPKAFDGCGGSIQKASSDGILMVPYSEQMSITKFIAHVVESVGKEEFEEGVNMVLDAFLKASSARETKYGSLHWSVDEELTFGNEKEQEHWNTLHSNEVEEEGLEAFKKLSEKKTLRSKDSILHYIIPISDPALSFPNGKKAKIYVRAFGLSVYAGSFVYTFTCPPKYLSLTSTEDANYNLFSRYLGLNNFNRRSYMANFEKDYPFMDAFAISGPMIKIKSSMQKNDEIVQLDYYGDYSFNIHMTTLVEKKINVPVKVKRADGKMTEKIETEIQFYGRKPGLSPIPKVKYEVLFKWMKYIKDYEKLSEPVKFVKDEQQEPDEDIEDDGDGDLNSKRSN